MPYIPAAMCSDFIIRILLAKIANKPKQSGNRRAGARFQVFVLSIFCQVFGQGVRVSGFVFCVLCFVFCVLLCCVLCVVVLCCVVVLLCLCLCLCFCVFVFLC